VEGAIVASGEASAPQNVYVGENGLVTLVFADGAASSYVVVVTREPEQELTSCNENIVSGVTETSDATHEACETLVVGPDFSAENGASIFMSSGLEIQFMPNFSIETGAALSAATCGQSLCETSAVPMPDGCHSCVVQICDVDSTCCDTGNPPVVQVFVTFDSYDGNFPGLAGADAACTNAATGAGLTGTWTAWLSDGVNDTDTDARDRILNGEYQLLDGTVVATSLADLTDGTLNTPINMDETGTVILGTAVQTWTGTSSDGTHQGAGLCTGWTSNDSGLVGGIGDLSAADSTWTDVGGGNACDVFNRLYCFADDSLDSLPPLMWDQVCVDKVDTVCSLVCE
jgi:hypothetical protein